ncbi:MAG: glycoside hydrolase family 16 protein [Chitinophagia bacterium]|nr:glycoside hydrolase family 16 protein [Chitinophagia bacterium]
MKKTMAFPPLSLALISILFILSPMHSSSQWKLVWSDEFKKDGLPDPGKWDYDIGGSGWGNNELQYYTKARKENARIENGKLIIEAHREPFEGKEYTSARLITRDIATWSSGKIEVSAKLPSGLGTWPAIWMLANTNPLKWPDDGEIDIMEHVGYDQGVVHASVHTKKYNHIIGTQKTNRINIADCSTNFHRYQLEWNNDSLRIGIDDHYYYSFKNENTGYDVWPLSNKFYLLLNLAVGGNWGGQKGVATDIWPRRMEVDYVRVYQKK